jgi:hypothetical protein
LLLDWQAVEDVALAATPELFVPFRSRSGGNARSIVSADGLLAEQEPCLLEGCGGNRRAAAPSGPETG